MYPCCLAIHWNAICCHSLCRPFVLCLCNKPLGGLNRLKYLCYVQHLPHSVLLWTNDWSLVNDIREGSTGQINIRHYTVTQIFLKSIRQIITCISTKRETFLRRLNSMSSQQDLGLFNLNSILFGKLQCVYIFLIISLKSVYSSFFSLDSYRASLIYPRDEL